MTKAITKEQFENIIEQANNIKPYCIDWGCLDVFGGYGEEFYVEGLEYPITPLIYDRNVFGIAYYDTVYYCTDNLNASRIAQIYARQGYCKLQQM